MTVCGDCFLGVEDADIISGADIDWEYPGAPDRGGKTADIENFVTLLKELRDAWGKKYGISATLPSSYWYLRWFDLKGLEKYLDWLNMMSYDIHVSLRIKCM